MQIQVSNYIDALQYMSTEEQYKQASEAIIGPNAIVKPGTDEYNDLARMRLRAKKILMGYRTAPYAQGFAAESNALAGNGYKCMPNCN